MGIDLDAPFTKINGLKSKGLLMFYIARRKGNEERYLRPIVDLIEALNG